ncbi:unnamed protein product [Cuscuta epithymum]|uniref:Uncharacterized protein n=1 Tax=Cuscuta epithymum TaxID=186058 RepID=A0AAV0FLG6_9ASTE|nr:unnamed protein product [Cuscuta epithymum]
MPSFVCGLVNCGSKTMEDGSAGRRKDDRDREEEQVGDLRIDDDGASESDFRAATREVINQATKVRPPPEPLPRTARGATYCARVQDFYFAYLVFLMFCPPPMRLYYFVIWFLITVYVVRCVSLFGILAFVQVIGYVWIFGDRNDCAKPVTWLAIHVALFRGDRL